MRNFFKKYARDILLFLLLFFFGSIVINLIRQPDIPANSTAFLEKDIVGEGGRFIVTKNRAFVVLFWGSWCPDCREDLNNFNEILDDVTVIGVAVNSGSDEEISSFLQKQNAALKSINDDDGMIANAFGINTYPTTIFYNSKGEIKFIQSGYITTAGLVARVKLIE